MSLFVAEMSLKSSKEGKAAMQIGDMDQERLTIHVQQVHKEKLRDREEFKNKRDKTGNESAQQMSYVSGHLSKRNKRDMFHHLLVHLHREIKVSILAKIYRTSELILHSLRVVWPKD